MLAYFVILNIILIMTTERSTLFVSQASKQANCF